MTSVSNQSGAVRQSKEYAQTHATNAWLAKVHGGDVDCAAYFACCSTKPLLEAGTVSRPSVDVSLSCALTFHCMVAVAAAAVALLLQRLHDTAMSQKRHGSHGCKHAKQLLA